MYEVDCYCYVLDKLLGAMFIYFYKENGFYLLFRFVVIVGRRVNLRSRVEQVILDFRFRVIYEGYFGGFQRNR